MNAHGRNNSSESVSIQDSPVVTEIQEQSSNTGRGNYDDSPQGSSQDRYNNINNNIKNTIKNKKSRGGAGAAIAAPPQFCIDTMNQFKNGNITKDEALEKIEDWYVSELQKYSSEHDTSTDSGFTKYKAMERELNEIGTRCWDIIKGKREDYYD